MSSLNKVMLIGRLGKDPEIRYTPDGAPVANFSLATSDFWTDKGGTRQERTEWHNIVAWNKLADLAKRYLAKGRQVYVEGRIRTRQWQDQQGQKRYSTEVVAQVIQLLGSRPDGASREEPGVMMPPDESATHDFGGGPDDDIPF